MVIGLPICQESHSHYARPFWQWYAAILLMLIYTCSMMDRTVANVVVQPVKAEFHLTDGQIGLVTGFVFGVANGVAGLLIGPFVDRVNRRNFLGGLVVLWSLATTGAGFAANFALLLGSRIAVGASEAGAVPTSLSMLANIFPANRRSTATGVFFMSAPLGTLLASAGGGLIAAHWGWRATFFAAGVPGVLLAALMIATLPEPLRAYDGAKRPGRQTPFSGLIETLGYVARQPSLAPHYLALMLFALVSGGKAAFLIAFFMRAHNLSIQAAGGILGFIGAGGGLFGVVMGGVIADRLGRKGGHRQQWWLALVAAGAALAEMAVVLAPTLPLAMAGLAIAAVIGTMWLGPGYGVATTFAPEAMRGKALVLLQMGANVATGSGALIGGLLSDAYGGANSLGLALMSLYCGLFVVSALFAVAALKNPPRPL
jgi:predicted MFS family arabinose efflux permease